MSGVIDSLERAQLRKVPAFQAGDRVKVHFQVVEGTRRRTQVFEGVVIRRQGKGARETFTVRKQSFGVGVERTFPLHSPKVERIEIASRGDVRRAKLYYLRGRVGRRARVRERRYVAAEPGAPPLTPAEQEAMEAEEALEAAAAETGEPEGADGPAETATGDETAEPATDEAAAPSTVTDESPATDEAADPGADTDESTDSDEAAAPGAVSDEVAEPSTVTDEAADPATADDAGAERS